MGLKSGLRSIVAGFDIKGAGHGEKPDFSPLTLTLDSNTALAPLLMKAATGGYFNAATLVGVRADGEPITYRMDSKVAFVTKVEDVAGAGLTVDLYYGAITVRTVTQDQLGNVGMRTALSMDECGTRRATRPSRHPTAC